jgi:phospholipid/cholesterol/gamma-HCH transport system ATP-binding protein
MAEPIIKFENVRKSFGFTPVLNGVNLSIYEGETTTIIGKSGVGKSVLLKHIIGLLEKDAGEIYFRGAPVSQMKNKEKKAFKRMFSYMFQGTALFDSMTIFQNIALPLQERTRMPKKDIRLKVREKMEQLDIQGIEDKFPSQISGGMKKRVALARALITDPKIVLFDEPTTGLDPIRKSTVHSMISDYQKKFGFTAVMVSHEIPDIFFISQRIAMLDEGCILFEGDPDEFQQADNPVIQQFIQGLEIGQDKLTGMAHKTQGEQRFKEAMSRFNRYKIPFAIILLTIENLDEVDTRIGHEATHTAFKTLAGHAEQQIRITDTCSRYGMNQILVILSDTSHDQADKVCAKLMNEMKKNAGIQIKPYPEFCFSISAGIAEFRKGDRLTDVIARAKSSKNIVYQFNVC